MEKACADDVPGLIEGSEDGSEDGSDAGGDDDDERAPPNPSERESTNPSTALEPDPQLKALIDLYNFQLKLTFVNALV